MRDPQKRALYRQIVEKLVMVISISEISKELGITRQTIYRIKKELEN